MRVRFSPVLVSVLLGLSLAACDQKTEPAQQDSGVADDSGNVPGTKVTVSYNSNDTDVDLSTLTPISSTTTVALSDVVLAALPGKDLANVTAMFLGSDGFDPSTKANCATIVPLAGDLLAQGTVDVSTANMSWPDSLAMPGCIYVKGLAKITITDVVAALHLTVSYAGTDYDVDISTVAVETSGKVLVSNAILAALPSLDVSTVNASDFLGSDGFDPATKANCIPVLPVLGPDLDLGFLDPATLDLTWDASLSMPGCLSVHGLGTIELVDAGQRLTVTYQSVDHTVDISTVAVETTGTAAGLCLVQNVVLKALPGTDLSTVEATDFIGSDGFDPTTKPSCQAAGVLPVVGTDFDQAYLDPATLNLTWDAALSKPGCLKVNGLGQILVADI